MYVGFSWCLLVCTGSCWCRLISAGLCLNGLLSLVSAGSSFSSGCISGPLYPASVPLEPITQIEELRPICKNVGRHEVLILRLGARRLGRRAVLLGSEEVLVRRGLPTRRMPLGEQWHPACISAGDVVSLHVFGQSWQHRCRGCDLELAHA